MRPLFASLWAASGLLTIAASAHAVSSAELYQNQAEFYGRFEARIRFAPGDGVVSSFFLWKSGSDASGAYWNELDFEKLGADCHMQTNAIFGAPNVGHSQVNAVAADLCGGYHTYGFEWAPTYISWQIDGNEVRRDTGATATAFAQNASAGMQIHFNVWPGDASFGGNFNPAILPVYQYISWIQYSTYVNNSFSLAWRQELDGGSVPSGWATGNWASPKGHSTHSPANVIFLNGISVLALTSDTATGFTGVPPADGAGGSSGAGGAGGTSGGGVGGSASGAAGSSSGAAGSSSGAAGSSSGAGGSSSGAAGSSSGAAGSSSGAAGSSSGAAGSSSGAAGSSSGAAGSNGGSGGAAAGGQSAGMSGAGTSGTNAGGVGGAGAAGAPISGGAGGSPAPNGETTPAGNTGCSCSLASSPRGSAAPSLLSFVALLAFRRRRRSLRI